MVAVMQSKKVLFGKFKNLILSVTNLVTAPANSSYRAK